MEKKQRFIISLNKQDLKTLDRLANAEKVSAIFAERGYRPAVIRRLLHIYRTSNLTPEEFVKQEYILSPHKS